MNWLKRRQPLDSNLKLWRDTLRSEFCGEKGLYPHNLEDLIQIDIPTELLVWAPTFVEVIEQYPVQYRKFLGDALIEDEQVQEIIELLCANKLYAGSDGSVKDSIWSHAYGFICGIKEGKY